MSVGLIKMWIALAAIAFMFLSVVLIMASRYKLNGFLKGLSATMAYLFMLVAGGMIVLVVFSGPVDE
ncbi:DUF2768 domain-containing protein [Aureibacillus halotolerans]|uniref:Uncharacterized protein DUF2768 n=1 Tax=Aureibacillus halotolerans TaxID=1508390 RepID=A0A4R6U4X6_9BACI|nr:DUF2768 domain-containing protein [Aureibacillus halotolerans]TDQ41540.1 uncharacterized protein DUF2768 [Aureibacillus halotolerans]